MYTPGFGGWGLVEDFGSRPVGVVKEEGRDWPNASRLNVVLTNDFSVSDRLFGSPRVYGPETAFEDLTGRTPYGTEADFRGVSSGQISGTRVLRPSGIPNAVAGFWATSYY